MRVTVLGNAAWSVPSLEALVDSPHDVVLVVTRTPRPAGRGGNPTPTPVADAARRASLPLAEVSTVKAGPGFDAIVRSRPDVLAVMAYGEILPKALLDVPRRLPVNVHFSLLPELRGAAPVQRAIIGGLTATGVTTMRMDEGMDTGPILLQQEEAIEGTDDAGSLGARLAAIGGRLLVDTLDRLEAGVLVERPQDDSLATVAPKLGLEDEILDWTESAEAVERRIRALSPTPGARTSYRGRTLKLFGAQATDRVAPQGRRPGEIAEVGRELLAVVAGDGVVAVQEVQPAGRRRMSAAEFVRGYRPEQGDLLGA